MAAPPAAAAKKARPTASLGGADAFDEAMAAHGGAEGVRSALEKASVGVALSEIRHFLAHDPRLPTRTRKAVQFLDGLRGQMVVAGKEQSHPEFFACPFAATQVQSYTFREVRQRFGDQFKEKFWPIFQAFNTLFPVLAPEPDGDGAVASLVGASGPGGK